MAGTLSDMLRWEGNNPPFFMNNFGFRIDEAELAPGTVGLLYDDNPQLTHATVRPFVWSVLLARGAVRPSEVLACLTPICSIEDLKSGFSEDVEDDRNRAEWLIDEVLGDMTASRLLEYSQDKDVWVLRYSAKALPTVIKAVAGVDGRMPQHFLMEMESQS